MKEAVVTTCRKDSDKFEGQSKGSTVWFNINSEFKKRKCSTLEPDLYKKLYEKDIEGQYMELYKTFFVLLDKESTKKKNATNATNLITQSEATALEVILVDKIRTVLSVNYGLIGEISSGLIGETRASVTPEKRIK